MTEEQAENYRNQVRVSMEQREATFAAPLGSVSEAVPRYEHKCMRCGESFSNIVKDCGYCCVCAVRIQRDEWD